MAIHDYRFDPFENAFNIKKIYDERHTVPANSPYTIRLVEVPQKTDPTTVQVKFQDGTALTEVSEEPAQGQYWPDYLTTEHGIAGWNTGTVKFSAADAGKVVLVSYNGMGTLTDERLLDQVDISVTSSTQPEREAVVPGLASWDTQTGPTKATNYRGSLISTYSVKQHRGIPAGTYTLRSILQELVNRSHTQEHIKANHQCDCNCDCNCGDSDND